MTMTEPVGEARDTPRLTAFYDGGCPVCVSEIDVYRRSAGSDDVRFVDVSDPAGDDPAPGLSRQQARSRFHVATADGRLVSGGRAFALLWSALPGWRRLGRLASLPICAAILDRAYDVFLHVRPTLQRLARRLLPSPGRRR